MNVPWSKEQTMGLIDLYRQYPCLWKVRSKEYRDRDKRAAALNSMCEHYEGMTTSDLKKKIEELEKI